MDRKTKKKEKKKKYSMQWEGDALYARGSNYIDDDVFADHHNDNNIGC